MTVLHLLDASLRAIILASFAGLLLAAARKKLAAFEHLFWTAVMLSMLIFAIPHAFTPTIPVTVSSELPFSTPSGSPLTPVLPLTPSSPPLAQLFNWQTIVFWIWLGGTTVCLIRLISGALLIRYRLRTANRILADNGSHIEESIYVKVPMTVGWPKPRILLPLEWRSWSTAKVRAALAHERSHVDRHDTLILLLATLNQAIFWFHPLSWFLTRRLSQLAEFAADEAALATISSRTDYARILMEIAKLVPADGNRLSGIGAAMNGLGRMESRIERVLEEHVHPIVNRRVFWCCAIPVICFLAFVQLQPVLRGQAGTGSVDREEEIRFSPLHQSMSFPPKDITRGPGGFTPEEVAEFEQRLKANPMDSDARLQLAVYYARNKQADRRLALIDWLIDNQPDSFLHTNLAFVIGPSADGSEAYDDVHIRWSKQLQQKPDNVHVVLNAAKSAGQANMSEELAILKQAQHLDPNHFTNLIALIFSMALTVSPPSGSPFTDPGFLAQVHQELALSNDPLLLGKTGSHLVEVASRHMLMHQPNFDFIGVRSLAIDLLARAQSLEPQNQAWADSMEGAKQLVTSTFSNPVAPAIRVAESVMKANLQFSPELKPQTAKGTVEFQVTISATGRVTTLTLVSGPPALISAAMNTVRQFIYEPLLLNGKAVDVETTVKLTFP